MDTFRQNYRELSEEEKQIISNIKNMSQSFLNALDGLGASRELSLAKTKLEECVMWAVKHVTG